MFFVRASQGLTYGDLLPYLSVAGGLALQGVPIAAMLSMSDAAAVQNAFRRSKVLLSKQLGPPCAAGPSAAKPAAAAAAAAVVGALGGLAATEDAKGGRFAYAVWLLQASHPGGKPGLVVLLVHAGDDLGWSIADAVDGGVRDPSERALWVTNGMSQHWSPRTDEWTFCKSCRNKTGANDTKDYLSVRQNHLEATLLTGDTPLLAGEIVFNVRSSVLFPADGKAWSFPDPLGMIKLKLTPEALESKMSSWFDGIDSAKASGEKVSTVCVAFGSFAHEVEAYKEVWKRLADFPDVRLLLQVADAAQGAWADDGRHLIHAGFMPNFEVFRRCDTVVHTGGAGTTAEALYLGKPQVILYEAVGADKANNAKQLGEFTAAVRECSYKLKPQDCYRLQAVLGTRAASAEEPAALVAEAIRRAPEAQRDSAPRLQKRVEGEMGDLREGDSKALGTVVQELHGLWARAPAFEYTGMPTLVFASELLPAGELADFARGVALRTDGVVAAVGLGGAISAAGAVPANLRLFDDAAALRARLPELMPVGRFAKVAVVACEPYEAFDAPFTYDIVYSPSCKWRGPHPWTSQVLRVSHKLSNAARAAERRIEKMAKDGGSGKTELIQNEQEMLRGIQLEMKKDRVDRYIRLAQQFFTSGAR